MIPAEFDYTAPDDLDGVFAALADGGEDAKLLAGGHSLLPLMKLRLAAPTLLVDLRKVDGLSGVTRENGHLRIGGMTRHVVLQDDPTLGAASKVARTIADQQVRNRGTIGGSVAHGDPASDLPTLVLTLDATIHTRSAGGTRELAAGEFFRDYLETALQADEVITHLTLPALPDHGSSYVKFTRRAEDWAMVGICAVAKRAADGTCEDVRVGMTNMGSTPLRASAVEEALRGQPLDAQHIAAAAEHAADGTSPPGDLNATPDYKRHLARVMTRRALMEAAGL